jgi:hypothetical protein
MISTPASVGPAPSYMKGVQVRMTSEPGKKNTLPR